MSHVFAFCLISNFALLTIWQFTKRRPIFGHDTAARQPTVSKSWLMRKLRGFAWESCGTQQIMHSVCTASICSVCSLCSHAFSAFVSHSKFHCFSKLKFLINGSCLWPLAGFCRIVSKFTNLATLTAFGPFEQKYMNGSWLTLYSFYSTLSLSLSLPPEEQDSTKAQVEALEAQNDQDKHVETAREMLEMCFWHHVNIGVACRRSWLKPSRKRPKRGRRSLHRAHAQLASIESIELIGINWHQLARSWRNLGTILV